MAANRLTPTISILPPPGPSALTASIPPIPHPSIPPLFHSALLIRTAVFVDEQRCSAAEEIDADDAVSWHWILFPPITEEGGSQKEGQESAAATIRLVPAQTHVDADDERSDERPNYGESTMWDGHEAYVKIGRLATLRELRGRGYGGMLVRAVLEWVGAHSVEAVRDKEVGPWKGLVLAHAQKSVEGWYAELGFERDRGMGVWWEEGIEHVGMWKRVEVRGVERNH